MPGTPVQSVERALHILMAFQEGEVALSLSEISRRIGLAPSTTHRLLATLLAHQFIEKREDNQYALGLRLLELGQRVQAGLGLRQVALPEMRRLATACGHAVTLFAPNDQAALCLERVPGANPIQVLAIDVGERLSLNCGAGPRVLLASLSDEEISRLHDAGRFPRLTDRTLVGLHDILADARRTRAQGYVLAVEDVVESVAAIGAPVQDVNGCWIGAISLVGIVPEIEGPQRETLIRALCQSAQAISVKLGYRGNHNP